MSEQIKIKYFADIDELEYIDGKSDWIDLRSAVDIEIKAGEFKKIPLGIAMQLPEGYEAHVVPRSSTFKNYGIIMTNSVGIIDNTFCGDGDEWQFPAFCLETRDFVNCKPVSVIKKNDRICQFRIIKNQPRIEFEKVECLGNVDRGGFGSSGKQ